MKNNQIYRIKGTDYKNMTVRLLEASGLTDLISEKNKANKGRMRIGIKPNLVSPNPASYGGTTHPEIIAGIIEYLRTHRDDEIVILEGSWVGDRTAEAFDVCGYYELAEKYGVGLIDLQKDKWHETSEGIRVCDTIDTIDFLINVPVLKGHCQTRITCALKNLKGVIPNVEKRHFHSMGLHKPIAKLNKAVKQDFIVIDHICGDLTFEDGGNPVVRNTIMTALDPVMTDAYVAELLHYDVKDIDYVVYAEKLGVGCSDTSKIEMTDISSDTVTAENHPVNTDKTDENDELPYDRRIIELQDAVCEVDSCSACYGYLIPALDMIRNDGRWEEFRSYIGDDRIAIGQGYRELSSKDVKGIKFGVGNCTKGLDQCIPGCPPLENQVYEAIIKLLDHKS